MRDTVYQEYKKTIHYSNRTGVRADLLRLPCAEGLGTHKMVRKIQASSEVWGKITGHHRHAGEVRGQAAANWPSTNGRA